MLLGAGSFSDRAAAIVGGMRSGRFGPGLNIDQLGRLLFADAL